MSFTAAGNEHTVPETNNVWAYEGASNILSSLTVHYAAEHPNDRAKLTRSERCFFGED